MSTQTNLECRYCMWEGTEEELGTIYESNRHNSQDHTLYEEKCCPDCKKNEYLISLEEEIEMV